MVIVTVVSAYTCSADDVYQTKIVYCAHVCCVECMQDIKHDDPSWAGSSPEAIHIHWDQAAAHTVFN